MTCFTIKTIGAIQLKSYFAYYCHIILLGYKQFERKLMKIYTKIASNKYNKLIWKVAFKLKGKI
tara:strand:- start:1 stop:192 length:192 start_codon:yes stop_codon:yes gene_type:complete